MWIITTMKNVGIGVGKKNYWQDGQVLYWLIISVLYMYLRDWKNQFQIEINWIRWYNEKEMINSCNDTKGIIMAIRYNKLWKKLIDENMMKVDLRDQAGITTNALAKLGKNEHVSTQVLEKVCKVLHCEIQDIMEFVPDEEREEK